MVREHHRWQSPALGRPMDLLWFGKWGRPILAFPTSLGGCTQNEDMGLIEGLRPKIDAGEVQVCCVDAIDGEAWYNERVPGEWKLRRYQQFERYLTDEVLPLIRIKAEREDLILFGASFGAYHAMTFAFRHPDLASRVVAFSGLFEIERFLSGWWSDDCYFLSPAACAPNFHPHDAERLRHIGFVVATGEHDHLANHNRWFAEVLRGKGLNVHAEIWPGVFGHDWPFWARHLPRFVP